jgi:hypothetical protein
LAARIGQLNLVEGSRLTRYTRCEPSINARDGTPRHAPDGPVL